MGLAFSGACLTGLKYQKTTSTSKLLTNQNNQLIIGKVIEPTQLKKRSIKAILTIEKIKTQNIWIKGRGKVIVYFKKNNSSEKLGVDDAIVFEPLLENVSPPKNPHEFDFRKYLSFHLIHQQAYLNPDNWRLLKKSQSKGLLRFANDSRKYLIQTLREKGITGKELAVASALILGYKDDIDEQSKDAYSSAGAMHVLAVSGLHVGIIFLIFNRLFSFIGKFKHGKIMRGVILILILWSYALLTGLSPSVMRSATMFSFIVASKMTSRNSNFFNTLAASALVLLIYNPLLIMEVGFQLSYMAVIGIVIIQPWINNWFNFRFWLPRKVWEITAVSIAAQIATFPLGLLYFHQFPNYFMLSNLIVIPLAISILYLGIITLSFSFIPIIGDYLALGLKYLIRFLNYSVNSIDSLPYSLTENIRFSVLDTWLIYLFIICIISLVAYRKFRFLLLGSVLLIAFLVSTLWKDYNDLGQRKLIVYNISQHTAINFINGNDNILIADKKLIENRGKLLFHVQNNWINNGVDNEIIIKTNDLINKHYLFTNYNLFGKQNYFQFYDCKIVIIDGKFNRKINNNKLSVDLLIITKNTSLSIKALLDAFDPKEIVIDASNSIYTSHRLKEEAHELNINCWSVLMDGAYSKDIY